jgi:hypothetical protein
METSAQVYVQQENGAFGRVFGLVQGCHCALFYARALKTGEEEWVLFGCSLEEVSKSVGVVLVGASFILKRASVFFYLNDWWITDHLN